MPAKKTRQPAPAVRYLLSADRQFRRLSLKKISERVKTARRRGRGSASHASRNPAPVRVAPIAFGLLGLLSLATLVGAWWPSSSSADAQIGHAQIPDVPADSVAVLTADVASAPAVMVKTPASSADPQIAGAQTGNAAVSTADASTAAVSAKEPASFPVVKASNARTAPAPVPSGSADAGDPRAETAPAPAPRPPLSEDVPPVTAASVDTVTISGCLDYDGKSVWLKDASGVEAPQTRSWRSGFLRKRAPRIALVNGPNGASAYDGHRVSVTGVLVDREMRVDSLSPIADHCE